MSEREATSIHPTAVVHSRAVIGAGCVIGPFAVIDEHVVLGDGCWLGPHVYVTGHTVIGARNRLHAGAVIGDAPQDLKYAGGATRLRIGDDNVLREYCTIHRSNKPEEDTILGNGNFLMGNCHVGHNCVIGNQNIIANGALLAGHVTLADRVFISGNCVVHQFSRIGRLALMQGISGISKDLPPFCVAYRANLLGGLNVIGLRRAGFTAGQRVELKQLYRALFRSGDRLAAALLQARNEFDSEVAMELIEFVAASRRGVCMPGVQGGSAPTDDEA